MLLTKNAIQVLEARYLLKNDLGRIIETPLELFQRVAKAVASVEKKPDRKKLETQFLEMMTDLRFLPNSPTLMNAGKKRGQLSACFVLPIEDSLESIFETLKNAALIHQSGGGTGFSFSHLRPEGSRVGGSQGIASGPVSFLRIYDVATETIKQGGTRRGANMAVLRVDHPDIFKFIECKMDLKSISNFNISVGITDQFILAVKEKKNFSLIDPFTNKSVRELSANLIFDRIVEAAWKSGDPGLVFLDRINEFNPTPQEGKMESTNPCGEQPLLPYESCNLGSLNLGKYFNHQKFNWDLYRIDIHLAVRFLDNVIDLNHYPVSECKKITLKNRKIGLGVMGFADLLLLLGVPYGSEEGREWGDKLLRFLDQEAKKASQNLARKRGSFPNWKGSRWQKLKIKPLRNATVSTVAPTGTISMIAGASSGIEPLFAGVFYRNVLSGEKLLEVHPSVEKLALQKGIEPQTLKEETLAQELGKAWSPAYMVSVEDHVKMQAVFQKHCDSAVSKTINLPKEATLSDVASAYLLAYELGCKGITVYRDQSKAEQVLVVRQEAPFCPSC